MINKRKLTFTSEKRYDFGQNDMFNETVALSIATLVPAIE
jgi:hypothetical protein